LFVKTPANIPLMFALEITFKEKNYGFNRAFAPAEKV
jgi:hypothetical protein